MGGQQIFCQPDKNCLKTKGDGKTFLHFKRWETNQFSKKRGTMIFAHNVKLMGGGGGLIKIISHNTPLSSIIFLKLINYLNGLLRGNLFDHVWLIKSSGSLCIFWKCGKKIVSTSFLTFSSKSYCLVPPTSVKGVHKLSLTSV